MSSTATATTTAIAPARTRNRNTGRHAATVAVPVATGKRVGAADTKSEKRSGFTKPSVRALGTIAGVMAPLPNNVAGLANQAHSMRLASLEAAAIRIAVLRSHKKNMIRVRHQDVVAANAISNRYVERRVVTVHVGLSDDVDA